MFVGPTGWYTVTLPSGTIKVWVNQDYDGGGWVLVIANRNNTLGLKDLTYNNAINTTNYMSGASVVAVTSGTSLAQVNVLVGLKYWKDLAGRQATNKITIVQYVADTHGRSLTGNHTRRHRWQIDGFTGLYAMTNAVSIGAEFGDGIVPGFYNYHALNGYNFTTYDLDQDQYGTNCSHLYNNTPWWYGSCWSGSYFGGGGGGSYTDSPYWVGSGSDYHPYGAVYIK